MVEVNIRLSKSAYLPGDTIHAKITLCNLGNGALSTEIQHTPHKRSSTTGTRLLSRRPNSLNSPFGVSENCAPRTRTPCDDAEVSRDASRIQHGSFSEKQQRGPEPEHRKTRSVTFGSVQTSYKDHRPILSSNSKPYSQTRDTEHLLNVHAQVVATFEIDPYVIRSDKFDILRGFGNLTSGGIVYDNIPAQASRWQFLGWRNLLQRNTATSPPSCGSATTAGCVFPIFRDVPEILGVQMTLYAGEEYTLWYSCALPYAVPPTHLGTILCTRYELKLAAQRTDHSVLTFSCPIRICSLHQSRCDLLRPPPLIEKRSSVTHIASKSCSSTTANRIRGKTILLDLLKQSKTSGDQAYISDDGTQGVDRKLIHPSSSSSNASPITQSNVQFDISRGIGEKVCTLALAKQLYYAGTILRGVMNFAQAQLNCAHYEVSLEGTEVPNSGYDVAPKENEDSLHRKVLDHVRVCCAFSEMSTFALAIPASVTGSFQTLPVDMQYNLLLEFRISDRTNHMAEGRTKHDLEFFPNDAEGARFECRIPVVIYPNLCFGKSVHRGQL